MDFKTDIEKHLEGSKLRPAEIVRVWGTCASTWYMWKSGVQPRCQQVANICVAISKLVGVAVSNGLLPVPEGIVKKARDEYIKDALRKARLIVQ